MPLKKNYQVICEINGVTFPSINAAAKALSMRETEVRNRLYNKFPGYTIIQKIEQGYTPVIIEGIEYASLKAVVEAGLATTSQQVGRRIKSNSARWIAWQYK